MKILRFPLTIDDYQEISVPTAYHVLSCAPARSTYEMKNSWGGMPTRTHGIDLWVRVATSDHNTALGIYIIGTGNEMMRHPTGGNLDLNFIGTCVMPNMLVWHVFTGPLKNEMEAEAKSIEDMKNLGKLK